MKVQLDCIIFPGLQGVISKAALTFEMPVFLSVNIGWTKRAQIPWSIQNSWTKVCMLGRQKMLLEESVGIQDKYYAIKAMRIEASFQQSTKFS